MYIDPRTSQTFNHASTVSCDNNPQNVKVIDLDTNEQSVLTPNPALRATSMFFEPKQVQSAIIPITLNAQEAGYYSNAEFKNFWNRVFFTKHSNFTLNFLGKAISNDFWATSEQHPTDFYSNPSKNGLNHFMGLPYAIIWFSGVICLRFHITDFSGRMSNLNSRYWLYAVDFFNNTGKNTLKFIKGMCQLYFFVRVHHWQLLLQFYIDWNLYQEIYLQ